MFIISKLFWSLAAPGQVLTLLLLAGVLWQRRLLVVLAATGFAALALLPVGVWLIAPLEDRFARQEPAHVDGILVLGGSVDEVAGAERGEPVLTNAVGRLTEALALVRRHPEARLVFSGGSGRLAGLSGPREADAVAQVWRNLGVDLGTVLLENRSRNTFENIQYSRNLVAPQPGETWLLVTSAFHMPRAVGICRHLGWPVLAHPTDYRTSAGDQFRLRPDLRFQLDLTTTALREWAGLLAYRLLGRTDQLWPAPEPG